jgi:anti-sigma factor RsiW
MTPQRPGEPEEIDDETKAILNERLKTIDEDAKTARPWAEVRAELRQKLRHAAPK